MEILNKFLYIILIVLSLGTIFWYFEVYRYRKVLKLDKVLLNASIDYYMLNCFEYHKGIEFKQVSNINDLVYSFKKISPQEYLGEEEYNKFKTFIKW